MQKRTEDICQFLLLAVLIACIVGIVLSLSACEALQAQRSEMRDLTFECSGDGCEHLNCEVTGTVKEDNTDTSIEVTK